MLSLDGRNDLPWGSSGVVLFAQDFMAGMSIVGGSCGFIFSVLFSWITTSCVASVSVIVNQLFWASFLKGVIFFIYLVFILFYF
jgi:hypothetical protein